MPIEGRQDLHIMADTGRGRGTSGGRGSTDRKTCYGYGHGSAPDQGLMLVEYSGYGSGVAHGFGERDSTGADHPHVE